MHILAHMGRCALVTALLVALSSQIPARHAVDIGGYDAAYTQGFFAPERAASREAPAYLAGSDGAARWTTADSALLFPQIGAPATLTIRLRGRPGPPTQATIQINDAPPQPLTLTEAWTEVSFAVTGGLTKPIDTLITIRTPPGALEGDPDGRSVGALLDAATLANSGWPIAPALFPLLLASLAGALWGALGLWRRRWWVGPLAIALLTLALYRLALPYPYPLRWLLPALCLLLCGALLVRRGPALAALRPWLADALAPPLVALWCIWQLLAASAHVTLATPGVEKDFRVFATRAFDGAEVFKADGFYNLGYPLLLWLTTPLHAGNPFLAARTVAALSGGAALLATWWLARRMLGSAGALLALALLACSPLFVEYSLYIGSDMPFAAACALCVALVMAAREPGNERTREPANQGTSEPANERTRERANQRTNEPRDGGGAAERRATIWLSALAGLCAGAAFLLRHPGLLLLPWGVLALWWRAGRGGAAGRRTTVWPFVLGALLTLLPQLAANLRDTGDPLFSQQAKNIWLAAFGGSDWGRWADVPNSVSVGAVLAEDPGRVARNWWGNVAAFLGTGGEDPSEFGRAWQLHLLGFPANLLALAGLASWILGVRGGRRAAWPLLWAALYVAGVSVGLGLPRFYLPLAPLYAIAAAWGALRLGELIGERAPRSAGAAPIAMGLIVAALCWPGVGIGQAAVLGAQPPDEVAAVALVQALVPPGERLLILDDPRSFLDKYSAIAHRAAPPPAAVSAASIAASEARYVLWSARRGPAPAGRELGRAGEYTLIQIER